MKRRICSFCFIICLVMFISLTIAAAPSSAARLPSEAAGPDWIINQDADKTPGPAVRLGPNNVAKLNKPALAKAPGAPMQPKITDGDATVKQLWQVRLLKTFVTIAVILVVIWGIVTASMCKPID